MQLEKQIFEWIAIFVLLFFAGTSKKCYQKTQRIYPTTQVWPIQPHPNSLPKSHSKSSTIITYPTTQCVFLKQFQTISLASKFLNVWWNTVAFYLCVCVCVCVCQFVPFIAKPFLHKKKKIRNWTILSTLQSGNNRETFSQSSFTV